MYITDLWWNWIPRNFAEVKAPGSSPGRSAKKVHQNITKGKA